MLAVFSSIIIFCSVSPYHYLAVSSYRRLSVPYWRNTCQCLLVTISGCETEFDSNLTSQVTIHKWWSTSNEDYLHRRPHICAWWEHFLTKFFSLASLHVTLCPNFLLWGHIFDHIPQTRTTTQQGTEMYLNSKNNPFQSLRIRLRWAERRTLRAQQRLRQLFCI